VALGIKPVGYKKFVGKLNSIYANTKMRKSAKENP